MNARRDDLRPRVAALVARLANGARDDTARDALLAEVLAWQAERVAPYGRLVRARPAPPWPALPTDVFRVTRVAAHPPLDDSRVFRTSGTTHGERGVHAFRDLSLYDLAARTAAAHALGFHGERVDLVMLAPHESEAGDSSLAYMLSRFEEWFAARTTWAWVGGRVDGARLTAALREAERAGRPALVLGTSFALAFAEDALGAARFTLPAGSGVMHTGGMKGRTRELDPAVFEAQLAARYGVPTEAVFMEYGMTELSSQLYGLGYRSLRVGDPPPDPAAARGLWAPGWVRVSIVDPESLAPLPDGAQGLVRIDDLANLDSVAAVQTADVGRLVGDRLFLHGRATDAPARGCSLATEEALGGSAHGR